MDIKNRRGVTLVELMVSVAILSIGVLGLIGALGGVQRALQNSKGKTLAVNFAQEKMQLLKQKDYYQVLVTTDPAYRTDYTPNIPYDAGYFPAETTLEGGISFTRLTYIQIVTEDSGAIVTLPPTTTDTGIKQITTTVLWTQGGEKKKYEVKSLFSSPDSSMANCIFSGTVRNAVTAVAISGARVSLTENEGWRDTTNAGGAYSINLNPGSYAMVATAPGYFTELRIVSIGPNASQTQDFNLTQMSSGTAQGTVWHNDHLVISRVVGSTVNADGFSQEYVELFNPTTYTWTLNGQIGLKFQRRTTQDAAPIAISISYSTPTIAAGGYYLFANTGTVQAGGLVTAADAVWESAIGGPNDLAFELFDPSPSPKQLNVIPVFEDGGGNGAGALMLYRLSDSTIFDRFGWKGGGAGSDPGFYETTAYDHAQTQGLNLQEQFRRFSSTSGFDASFGPAYDSGNNDVDWNLSGTVTEAPRNSASTSTAIAGVPSIGAVVSCTDGLSIATAAYSVGSPPRADFALTQIATGTWTVYIASSSLLLEHSTVTIAATGSVYTFPSSTTILNDSNSFAFVSGRVTDALGNPITPAITVTPGIAGSDTTANTGTGRYLLPVTPGLVDITANPNSANTSYVSASSISLSIALGEVHSGVDFVLSQGGRITGWMTRDGTNHLPGIAVAMLDANGVTQDQQVSDINGRFFSVNFATGVYTVEPALASLEGSIPASVSVTVTIGATVSAGTFTITGVLGAITGSVTAAGKPISTGVLIVVTTRTLTGTPPAPPALSSTTLTSSAYYITSSYETGTYSVEVAQSTTTPYRVYAYYPVVSPTGAVTINSSVITPVPVLAGQTVTGQNFAW